MRKTLYFVTGGAASGKSTFAETLARGTEKPKIYVATMQPYDDEMRAKLTKHQSDRGDDWTTIEAPIDVVTILKKAQPTDVILLDCVTLWLTNVLLADHDVEAACGELVNALVTCRCDVVVVSNEVGMGIVPDNALSRKFRNMQGKINQMIAARADTVITVISGLPLVLKGSCDLVSATHVFPAGKV
ncbi:adenosylcobinamide kinase/adenosylcobinamide-phosphate guanylyltransferase [Loktanella ponticola]|uniref:Bifunctional adenosylcobalamin biosynthesis protein n=1 Tax=Yoonia ponticola TaxID=1524255 RepID=A0A7W9EWD3_9RHOB|nr:bifunctional adenosylcobinamide kinase/adenosylcobinamide-phosphate guanylyltransferase [Yoonia ponticola]MBB5720489.1 adenosylcobinamide kinase/adenosylcobinamide-phosphate guanylyltransferase [Yoonia ponticola]